MIFSRCLDLSKGEIEDLGEITFGFFGIGDAFASGGLISSRGKKSFR
jgi:hypothetical protein